MKKIILVLICIFSYLDIVNASIVVNNTSYKVKVNNEIINIKEISFDGNALFNIDLNNYEISDNLNEYQENNDSIYKFSTIVYYGYISDPTYENYIITQIIIWEMIGGYNVELENLSSTMLEKYNVIVNKINNHYLKSSIFDKSYGHFIWQGGSFTYDDKAIILDNPVVEGLLIKTIDNNIQIYPQKIGEYILNFKKNYDNEVHTYKEGNNIYWQSLKGPEDISYSFTYKVFGAKLNIIENLIGINGKTGDAKLNSNYQIICNRKELFTTSDLDNIYLPPQKYYKIKDISNTYGINNAEEISIKMVGDGITLNINKYVISKNISVSILDDYEYNIYLKSNNEIYEKINNMTDVITLPYGVYYIENKETDYYQEIIVNDSIDEEIIIKNEEKEVIVPEDIKNEEIIEKLPEANNPIVDNVENPKTLDNIDVYLIGFICSIVLLSLLFKLIKI